MVCVRYMFLNTLIYSANTLLILWAMFIYLTLNNSKIVYIIYKIMNNFFYYSLIEHNYDK